MPIISSLCMGKLVLSQSSFTCALYMQLFQMVESGWILEDCLTPEISLLPLLLEMYMVFGPQLIIIYCVLDPRICLHKSILHSETWRLIKLLLRVLHIVTNANSYAPLSTDTYGDSRLQNMPIQIWFLYVWEIY